MKQLIKRGSLLFLAAILVFTMTGCKKGKEEYQEQGKADQEGAKGRYVEHLLASPEGYQGDGSICLRENGDLVIVDRNKGMIHLSPDNGATWKSEENKVIKNLAEKDTVEITSATSAPDGGLFISYIVWNESTDKKAFPEKYIYIDPNGKKSEFELGIDNYSSSVTKAVFTDDSRLFIAVSNQTIYEIDLKKKKAKKQLEIENGSEPDIFSFGECIVVHNGKKVYVYDPNAESTESSDGVLNEFVEKDSQNLGTVVFGGNDGEKLFAATENGIYSHVIRGGVMEQLAEGSLTSLGDPSKTPLELIVLKNGSILIAYDDGELDTYTYDSEVSAVPEKQLKIYSLYENETVKRAISSFRKNNSDVYVKMEIGVTGEDGVTVSDAIKNLNTELVAGNGPDIILLDGMPFDSYIDKGVLMDLTDIVKTLEGESQFFKNIVEAYSSNGKIYAVPGRFKLFLMSGEKDVVSKIKDLKSMADVAEEQADSKEAAETVFGTYSAEELLERLYPVCEGAWYGEETGVNQNAVVEFLTQAKRIYEAEQKHLDETKIKEKKDTLDGLKENRNYHANESPSMDGYLQAFSQYSGKQKIVNGIYRGMKDFEILASVNRKLEQNSFQVFCGQVKNVFIPSGIMGITANSKEPQLAVAFLKEMLGEQVQKNDLEDGLPVNKDAFQAYCQNPYEDSSTLVAGDMGDELEIAWPNKNELDQLEKVIGELQVPANLNESIRDEVLKIGKSVLTGEKEIESCAEEICQKIMLFNEE